MISVGFASDVDSATAAQAALGRALVGMAPGMAPGLVLAFVGGRHGWAAIVAEIRQRLPGVPVVGGAAVGCIGPDRLGYSGFELCIGLLPQVGDPYRIGVVVDMAGKGEARAGAELGAALKPRARAGQSLLLLFDSVRSGSKAAIYAASAIINGLLDGLAGTEVDVSGAGMLADFNFGASYLFTERGLVADAVIGILLPWPLHAVTTILHGCMPVSTFFEITEVDGPLVLTLDDRSALDVVRDCAGAECLKGDGTGRPLIRIALGCKHGDRFAPFDEACYVNRLVLGTDPARGALRLLDHDLKVGDHIQVMIRDTQLVLESACDQAARIAARYAAHPPLGALYFDCAGRANAISGLRIEEASVLQSALAGVAPLIGCYSGVEVASLLGRPRPLDWTGVLTILERRP